MKQNNNSFGWKKVLFAAAAVVLLAAAGFGIKAIIDRGSVPEQTAEAKPAPQGAEPTETAAEPAETVLPTNEPDADAQDAPAWERSDNDVRLNRFLTAIVQQDIENSETDLDDDAELVRFAFGWRKYYEAESIIEQEDGNGESCPTLTLEQVNETLDTFFGRTVSPDHEDYSVLNDEGEGFCCVFRDGSFWNVPPYPETKYDFPLRFALVDGINTENSMLHFRIYLINPVAWGVGEAERHVSILPMMSIYDAENRRGETRNWFRKIGEGTAVLTDLGEEMKLVDLTTSLY